MRRQLLILIAVIALAIVAGAVGLRGWLHAPLPIAASGYRLEVPAGASLATVARQLSADGIVSAPTLLTLYGRLSGQASRIKAGEYVFNAGLTAHGLLAELVAGRVLLHGFTLVEGWTVAEIMAALKKSEVLEKTLETADATVLATRLGLESSSAEGQFLPETYLFPRGTTDAELLRRAHAAMQKALATAWEGRDPDLPLQSPYELLVLASIIERETALAAERPLIAGVFMRRLRKGMLLQTDPSVIYGLGAQFDGNLTRRHLETDTPWNTYTRPGLPPTPIASPGTDALSAAAHPAPGTALFFVATGKGDGSHRFSATLAEHQEAVRQYLATLKARSRQ
ncbi:MAG: endolytic transglycosylase MltG [Gammaproteobacteria bacterium]